MKIIKKIFLTITIVILTLTSFGGNKSYGLSQDAIGLVVVQAAVNYMKQYGGETFYSTAQYNRGQTVFYQKKTEGRWGYGYYLDCASFVQLAFIRGISIEKYYPMYNDPSGAYTGFDPSATTPEGQIDIPPFEVVQGGVSAIKPGDVVMTRHASGSGHVMLYTGDGYVIHCDGNGSGKGQGGISWEPLETYASKQGENTSNYTAYRYSGEASDDIGEIEIQPPVTDAIKVITDWIYKKVPFRTVDESNIDKNKTFEYQGIAKLESKTTTEVEETESPWRFPVISDLIEWILNFICTIIKAVFVGFATLVQVLITYYIDAASGEDVSSRLSDGMMAYFTNGGLQKDISDSITMEKIVYNKVPLLDVNIFNGNVAGGKTLDSSSLVIIIRNVVAGLYMSVRKVSIIALLIVLIYYGIKFATSAVGEAKADCKQKLLNWAIAFFIVFGLHYFLIAVMKINELVVGLISNVGTNIASSISDGQYFDLATGMRELTYQTGIVKSILSTCLYMAMVYYIIKFIIIYFKRLFVTLILIILAPFMGIKFAVDRLKFKQSSSFTTWAKEYIFSVGTQTIHALVYTIFIGITYKMAINMDVAKMAVCILAFIFFRFMTEAEKMLRSFLKLTGGTASSIIGDVASTDIKDIFGWMALARMHKYTKRMVEPASLKKKYETAKQFMRHSVENEYIKMKRSEYIERYNEAYRPDGKGRKIRVTSNIDKQIDEALKLEFKHKLDKAFSEIETSKKLAKSAGRIVIGIPITIVEDGLATGLVATGGYTLIKALGGKITGYKSASEIAKYRAKDGTYQNLQIWVNENATSKVARELRRQYLYSEDDETAENKANIALLHQARTTEVNMQYEIAQLKEKMLKGADGVDSTSKIQNELAKTYTKKLRRSVEETMKTVDRKDIQQQVKDYMKENNKYALTMEDFEIIAEEFKVQTSNGEEVEGLIDVEGLTENIKKETVAQFISEITEHDGIGNGIILDSEAIEKVESNIKDKINETTDETKKQTMINAMKCLEDEKKEIEGKEKKNVFSNLNEEEQQQVKEIIKEATDIELQEKQKPMTLDKEVMNNVENNIKEKMEKTEDTSEKQSMLNAIKCIEDKRNEIEGKEKKNVFSNLNKEEQAKVKGILKEATDEKSIEKQVTRLNRDQIIDTMKKAVDTEGSIKRETPKLEIPEFEPVIKQAEKMRDINELARERGEKPIYKDVGQLIESMIKNSSIRLDKKTNNNTNFRPQGAKISTTDKLQNILDKLNGENEDNK